MFKNRTFKKADKAIVRSADFKIDFSKEIFIKDFNDMRIFLQPVNYVPAPSGAECVLCTITISEANPVLKLLGENNRRVIIVGREFMNLPHMKKMILLTAETYRQNQKIITGLSRPEGISSTGLDREIAIRQALATQFKPKLIQKTLSHRDAVVINSTAVIAKSIYLESKDIHYKPSKHPFGQGDGAYRCYPANETPKSWGQPLTDEEFQEELERLKEFGVES